MPRIVMKFGGTSMAGIERIRNVASRVRREAEAGNEVLVVVSAMAGETDRLVQLCRLVLVVGRGEGVDIRLVEPDSIRVPIERHRLRRDVVGA